MAARGASVPIPTDVVTAKAFSATATATVKAAKDVADDDLILDVGPDTARLLAAIMGSAAFLEPLTSTWPASRTGPSI